VKATIVVEYAYDQAAYEADEAYKGKTVEDAAEYDKEFLNDEEQAEAIADFLEWLKDWGIKHSVSVNVEV